MQDLRLTNLISQIATIVRITSSRVSTRIVLSFGMKGCVLQKFSIASILICTFATSCSRVEQSTEIKAHKSGQSFTNTNQILNDPILGRDRNETKNVTANTIDMPRWFLKHRFRVISPMGHTSLVTKVTYSSDGKLVASCSQDSLIIIRDASTQKMIGNPLAGHKEVILDISFSPDSKSLVSVSADKSVRIWNVETGELKAINTEMLGQKPISSSFVRYSPDGRSVITANTGNSIGIWDLTTGLLTFDKFQGHSKPISSIAFSNDGKTMATASGDKSIIFWEYLTGVKKGSPIQLANTASAMIFLADDKSLAYKSNGDVFILNIESGKETQPTNTNELVGRGIAYSPKSNLLASGLENGFRVWNLGNGTSRDIKVIENDTRHIVTTLDFSKDGKTIVTGSYESHVQFWDVETGVPKGISYSDRQVMPFPSGNLLARSHDGKLVATQSDDNSVRIWDMQSGLASASLLKGHQSAIDSIAFSVDDRLLAASAKDNSIRIWNTSTGKMIGKPLIGHIGPVSCLAFTSDSKILATGSNDNTIRLWDVNTGDLKQPPLKGHQGAVRSLAFTNKAGFLFSGSTDLTIRIWDISKGISVGKPLPGHRDPIKFLSVSPNDRELASFAVGDKLRVWQLDSVLNQGVPVFNDLVEPGTLGDISSLFFSENGKTLSVLDRECKLTSWKIEDKNKSVDSIENYEGSFRETCISPDCNTMVALHGYNQMSIWVKVWPQQHMLGNPLLEHDEPVLSLAISPDGNSIVSGSEDRTLILWNLQARVPRVRVPSKHKGQVTSIAFSPDGKMIATGSNYDSTIHFTNAETGESTGTSITGYWGGIHSLVYSADGKKLASGDNLLHLWDLQSLQGTLQDRRIKSGINTVIFSQDGSKFAYNNFDSIVVCDAIDMKIRQELKDIQSQGLTKIAFSPDGKSLAAGTRDNMIMIFDSENLKSKPRLLGVQGKFPWFANQPGGVTSFVFTPDGRILVTGHSNQFIIAWDLNTGRMLGNPIAGQQGIVWGLIFLPDGKTLVSAHANKSICFWDISTIKNFNGK